MVWKGWKRIRGHFLKWNCIYFGLWWWRVHSLSIGKETVFKNGIGVPGWLSQLSTRLQLRSWSHGSWVWAPHRALGCQHRAHVGPSDPPSLHLHHTCALSLSLKNKWALKKKKKPTVFTDSAHGSKGAPDQAPWRDTNNFICVACTTSRDRWRPAESPPRATQLYFT